MSVKITIRRGSETQTIQARSGLGFQAICARHNTGIEFDCRASDCGICIVKVIEGAEALSPKTVAEADFLRAMNADPDERLACQTRFMGDVEIAVDYL
jgi:ferredoxin